MTSVTAPTAPRYRMSVQFMRAQDLANSLRAVGPETQIVISSLVERKFGEAVDVGLSFSDGTGTVTLKGVVRWCRPAPPSAHVPFLVGVGLDFAMTLVARRLAGGEAKRTHRKRNFDRFDTSILVGINTGATAGPGRIEDLSLGGARIVADLEPVPERGSIVTIEFVEARLRLKTRAIRAKVCWVDANPSSQRGFGVQFESVDAATRDVIQREVNDAAIGKKPKR